MKSHVFVLLAAVAIAGCQTLAFTPQQAGGTVKPTGVGTRPGGIGTSLQKLTPAAGNELAAFSGGCFWGTENVFRHVDGVVATAVGYTGGTVAHPTYEMVCTHRTGHAETVLIEFNPKKVSYKKLLDTFWNAHDPTTLDRQGPDYGNNYRSAIWTFGDDQLKVAKESLAADQKKEDAPIVTTIKPLGMFWLAEDYHQQYDEKTGTNTCPLPRHGDH
jgi:peptide-methionine (S)-S-oxide reductase